VGSECVAFSLQWCPVLPRGFFLGSWGWRLNHLTVVNDCIEFAKDRTHSIHDCRFAVRKNLIFKYSCKFRFDLLSLINNTVLSDLFALFLHLLVHFLNNECLQTSQSILLNVSHDLLCFPNDFDCNLFSQSFLKNSRQLFSHSLSDFLLKVFHLFSMRLFLLLLELNDLLIHQLDIFK